MSLVRRHRWYFRSFLDKDIAGAAWMFPNQRDRAYLYGQVVFFDGKLRVNKVANPFEKNNNRADGLQFVLSVRCQRGGESLCHYVCRNGDRKSWASLSHFTFNRRRTLCSGS
jgi:hypothetical protein